MKIVPFKVCTECYDKYSKVERLNSIAFCSYLT